ncbi:unnamed protein product [Thelazia callipaeda]|uniref:Transmembrane protein n=1 Tax=Thelazia callipaeda TaxID=103827 RepID=A0A0N5DC52_THECL|nr:unnamed protein product [Thelazia callipaeda]
MSSMLSGAPGMASDYLPRHHSIYGVTESNALPQMSDDEILKPAKEIIHFDALSLLSVLQVLCSLVIFGCGVLRIIWNSKWAIGLEIIFALLVFVAGVTGICATSRRALGSAVKHVEKLRVSFDLKGTFEGISETMEKNLDRLDSKEVL